MTSIDIDEEDRSNYPLETEGDFVKEAAAGSPQAQYMLGLAYADGLRGFPVDVPKAKALWLKAAEAGEQNAMLTCVREYRSGDYLPADIGQAEFWCDKLLELPPPYDPSRALLEKGRILDEQGQREEAVKRYHESAMTYGCIPALAPYGMCLLKGAGIEKDEAKGMEILNTYMRDLAPRRDDARALMRSVLGMELPIPETAEEDHRRAACGEQFRLERLIHSATQGHARAQWILVQEYENGEFTNHPDNRKHALHWLNRRAEAGEAMAFLRLHDFYMSEADNPGSRDAAMVCLRQAVDMQEPGAHSRMGYLLFAGKILDRDLEKAAVHLEKAAAANDWEAMLLLSVLLKEGLGVSPDPARAGKLAQQSLGRRDLYTRLRHKKHRYIELVLQEIKAKGTN